MSLFRIYLTVLHGLLFSFVFLKASNAIPASSLPRKYKEAFKTLSQTFKSCHLQFLTSNHASFLGSNNEFLQTSLQLIMERTSFDQHKVNIYSICDISATGVDPNFHFHPQNKNSHTIHKYVQCHIHLYLQLPDANRVYETSWLSNPQFVLFVLENVAEESWPRINLDLTTTLQLSYYTVTFVYIVTYLMYTVGLSISPKSLTYESKFPNLTQLTQRFYKKANLHSQFIDSDLGSGEKSRKITSCDLSIKFSVTNRPPTVEECVVLYISRKLNFTFVSGWSPIKITRRHVLSLEMVASYLIPNKRVISELGLLYDQWAYVVIKDKIPVHDEALLGPFSLLTWISIGAGLLLTSLVFLIAAFINAEKMSFSFIWILASLYGAMLDQSLYPKVISGWGQIRNSPVLKLNWILWYITMTFIVNQGYKCDMYSCLTKAPNPSYPGTLPELAESQIQVITYSSMTHKGQTKASANVHIEETIFSAVINNASYPTYFQKLERQLKFYSHWLDGLRKYVAMHFAQVHSFLLPNGTYVWDSVPKEYAVFEPLKHARMQRQVLNLFLPQKFVSPVIRVNKFASTMPWVVNKGFFYPLFKRALGQLYESGLYTRWDGFHDDINGVDNFHWVLKYFDVMKVDYSKFEFPVKKQLWNGYYFTTKLMKTLSETSNEVAVVSAYTLRIVWLVTIVLMGIALSVFLIELIVNFIL